VKILTATVSIIGLAFKPFILMLLFDYDFSRGPTLVIIYIVLYIVCTLISMLFEYVSQLHAWKLEQKFNEIVKQDLFHSITRKEYQDFSSDSIGYYVSLFNNDVKAFEQHLESLVAIIQTIIQLVIYGVFLFVLDYRLAIIIILSSLLSLLIPKLTGKKLADKTSVHLEFMGKYTNIIQDLLGGFKAINIMSRVNISRYHKRNLVETEQKLYDYGKYNTFTNVISGSSMYLLEIIVLVSISVLLLLSRITIGIAIAALNYIQNFVYPFSYVLREINNFNATKVAKTKILSIINQDAKEKNMVNEFIHKIELNNVSINYKDFSLENFSYVFEKGKKYAIVGHSGSGKTTLTNIILQYEKSYQGMVTIDGVDIKNIGTDLIFSNICQNEHIYDTDFFNNASLFGSFDEDRVQKSIDFLNNEIISDISTKEDCTSLSGGEKQLLLAVRMLSKNAPILILDEAFSALDKNNRADIEKLILSQPEKTIIFITHDLNIKNTHLFDEIINIDSLI